jgi:hypothetical protein
MKPAELEAFTARLARFTDKGVTQIGAEVTVTELVGRDRDSDDRRLREN